MEKVNTTKNPSGLYSQKNGRCIGISKGKPKAYRPIILLRRNSCGNISSKIPQQNVPIGMSCLKSMTDSEKLEAQPVQNEVDISKVKTEPNPDESFDGLGEYCNTSNFVKPTVKTEIVGNISSSPWSNVTATQQEQLSSLWRPKPLLSQSLSGCTNLPPTIQSSKFMPSAPCSFLKQRCISSQNNCPAGGYVICNSHYQTIRPMSVPLSNTAFNNFLPTSHKSPSNLHCSSYMLSTVTPTPIATVELMPENRPVFYRGASTNLSDGAIFQPYTSSTSAFQVQNTSLRPGNANFHINAQLNGLQSQHGETVADDSLTNITWLGKMGVNNFMPVPLESEKKPSENERKGRPPYSYMALIQFAINSSATGRMTLRQIYQWIEEKFPYFKTAKPGWKNSIRHNLSLHDLFVREVTNGSKASFWTLRPDLNVRPLTLDNVVTSPSEGPMWSLQTCGHGQKPILPRLPLCSQPYVLLPIPVLQPNREVPAPSFVEKTRGPEGSGSISRDGSSMFIDSGFNSDMSHCTPGTSNKSVMLFFPDSGSLAQKKSSTLKPSSANSESYPLLSQSANNRGTSKRSRKEPLKTLNDSMNSSLQFLKDGLTSPSRPSLSPSGEQFVLCKRVGKKKKEVDFSSKSTVVGLSDESFSELLNDLGSPFKMYLTHNATNVNSSPNSDSARKRRRSWGSPESSCSGTGFQRKLRAVNEKTPASRHIRRVKSDAGELVSMMKNSHRLPSSTPLSQEKWKTPNHRSIHDTAAESQENLQPASPDYHDKENWQGSEAMSSNLRAIPSPIPNSQVDSDIDGAFFEEIIGTVFKTPDKPTTPIRHFASLSPERPPFGDITSTYINSCGTNVSNAEASHTRQNEGSTVFASCSPSKDEPLNTSFSKLLDISGGSGSFRFPSNLSEVGDLNLSWSNLPHF